MNRSPIETLLSLPASSTAYYSTHPIRADRDIFVACDPPGRKLGSGGGVARILLDAWAAGKQRRRFGQWMHDSRKLIVLGGGQSRRLPAYAAVGKPLIPIPVLPGSWCQSLDQTLMDLQMETFQSVLSQAPERLRVMVTSGDVLFRFSGPLPAVPDVDVLLVGMQVDPETASHLGVFFVPRQGGDGLAFALQKPAVEKIKELSLEHRFLVDTGMWLLSERAVEVLLARCGHSGAPEENAAKATGTYELYSQFGLALGERPTEHDPEIGALSCGVLALPDPEFYNLGTNRQLIESVYELQSREGRRPLVGVARAYWDQIVQNSVFEVPVRRDVNRMLWVENSSVPSSWRLTQQHVITGAPDNAWNLELEPGVCLDFVPIGERDFCVRVYGLDDQFAGSLGGRQTTWLGRPAEEWFSDREITPEQAGLDQAADIYQSALFPVLPIESISGGLLEWLTSAQPQASEEYLNLWLKARRLSAQQINLQANLERLEAQRAANRHRSLQKLYRNRQRNIFYRLNLEETARLFAAGPDELPAAGVADTNPLNQIHDHMWRGAVLRQRGCEGAAAEEARAFACLREAILDDVRQRPPRPACRVLPDQIIWGRAPVRLDLAGGWTDTPPYCLQHGGQVVNVAVDLNGQPPIQVFAKLAEHRQIVIRSIDLGCEERIASYEDLQAYNQVGGPFALAKAALVLAGFLPGFYESGGWPSLAAQLDAFGGGIELSLVAAVPQGSGLGTSSILAATLLSTVGELCGLNWDHERLIALTLALEQMLTSGGGWQDQAGGVLRGLKLVRTGPGIIQSITPRWLPDHLLTGAAANTSIMLYYTGLTRLAKNILQEIVRGMFLNSARVHDILGQIGDTADQLADAVQRADWEGLCEGVRRSWDLNRRLDVSTNPPAVQSILDRVQDYLAGVKLLGAGGGGYMVMLAKDEAAGRRIRQILESNPPNPKARFVDYSVSQIGLEVTKS